MQARKTMTDENSDVAQIKDTHEQFYGLLLYKAKSIPLVFGLSKRWFAVNFTKGGVEKAIRFEKVLKALILTCFSLAVVFTLVDLNASSSTWEEAKEKSDDHVKSEFAVFPLDIIQITTALLSIYFLFIYQRFMSKIVKRDDPFSNANILGFIIFCVVIQKYLVEVIFHDFLKEEMNAQATIVVIRQTILSIELLFVIIPIRHNFSLDHVET